MATTTHQMLSESGYLYAEAAICSTCQQEQSTQPITCHEMKEKWKAGTKYLLSDFLQVHASHQYLHRWFEFLPEKKEKFKQVWANHVARFQGSA